MKKQDLTKYSDNELSLMVFNTIHLYEGRHWDGFFEYLKMTYKYTDKQLEVLKHDLLMDYNEINGVK